MIKEHFTEWFIDTLIPKLPPRSVVVMDNAPFHSHLGPDSKRWAKFETRVVREFEEKLRKLDGIRDEDVNPVVNDMTDDDSDDSQKTIPYQFSEGEEGINENGFEDSVSHTINDADVILCNTCGNTEPPTSIQKEKYISSFKCDTCDRWVHNRCCTKPALARNVCLRCFSIFNHRNLSEPLILPIEDKEQ
ncbi:unnamed protein product [Mytilus coruscus]|uniref:Tc1-like transposase DDE domain-containing protein n=1 Tax=Mytilus coruscus TaxID=42192 RepID=A0A6J8A0B4_MYTCO|nr:unnamed protein product [Mytilus coruscus]